MFTKELFNLTLTSNIAAEVFPNICGSAYGSDNSFLATLRAILAPRMTNDDKLWLDVRTKNGRSILINDRNDSEIVAELVCEHMTGGKFEDNTIFVCGLNGTENWNTSVIKSVDNSFAKDFKNFQELKDIRVFVDRQINANIRFYINSEDRSVVIFAADLNIKIWHFIQSFIPRYFPWYFEPKEKHLADYEKTLLKSLILKTAKSYEQTIESFTLKYDFRSKKIKGLVGGLEKRSKKKQLDVVRRNIADQENKIERIMNDYTHLIQNMQDYKIRESGLMWQMEHSADDNELVDYLIHNKHINILSVSDDAIEIIIGTTIDNYDADLCERMVKNTDSFMYDGYTVTNEVFANVEARQKLIKALFGDDAILGAKVCAYYKLGLSGKVSVTQKYNYPKPEYEDFLTNPHFYFFACIGTYRSCINDALRKGDYLGAIEQCVISAQTLNMTEGSQTVAPFMGQIFNSNKAIIKMPDGTSLTPTEAYNWLVSQEQNNEETQEVKKNVEAD